MPFRPALSQTLAAHRPAFMYTAAAVTWGGATAAAAEDVDIDAMLLIALAALAATVIAFQHAMITRGQRAAEEARRATEALTRAVVNRPHDRDHDETGPYAIVSSLHGRSGLRASR